MRIWLAAAVLVTACTVGTIREARGACGACKAEQVTTATANALLFGGTDAAGGIGDWYLTNGKLVAIIDNIDTETISTRKQFLR